MATIAPEDTNVMPMPRNERTGAVVVKSRYWQMEHEVSALDVGPCWTPDWTPPQWGADALAEAADAIEAELLAALATAGPPGPPARRPYDSPRTLARCE